MGGRDTDRSSTSSSVLFFGFFSFFRADDRSSASPERDGRLTGVYSLRGFSDGMSHSSVSAFHVDLSQI
jgi:hypothetical protein